MLYSYFKYIFSSILSLTIELHLNGVGLHGQLPGAAGSSVETPLAQVREVRKGGMALGEGRPRSSISNSKKIFQNMLPGYLCEVY